MQKCMARDMSRDEFPLLAPEEPGTVMELTDTLIKGLGIPAEFLQKENESGSMIRFSDLNRLKRRTKSVHAIAHFDFDGSCAGCSLWTGWDEVVCGISKTQFSVSMVPEGQRHEHCPLCIEEEG